MSRNKKETEKMPKFVPWEPCRAAASKRQTASTAFRRGLPANIVPYKLTEPIKISTGRHKCQVVEEKVVEDAKNKKQQQERDSCPVSQEKSLPSFIEADAPDDPVRDENSQVLLELDCRRSIEKLNGEKKSLEIELDFQRKVNNELKALLVATMGEDLQSHIDALSQDKIRLGHNILDYSEQWSIDREKTEDLTISGDIWRSKYLAASVMTDELISAKVQLLKHLHKGQAAVHHLLQEQHQLRRSLLHSIALLSHLKDSIDSTSINQKLIISSETLSQMSTLELGAVIDTLCNGIRIKLAVEMPKRMDIEINCGSWWTKEAADFAGLSFEAGSPAKKLHRRDISYGYQTACNFRNLTVACCKNCAGREIKLV